MPLHIKNIIGDLHDDVVSKYYGCGLVQPQQLLNTKILDLGSGSGRDCYILSHLVGEKGYIVGVDMTDEQLNTARQSIDYHMEKFGFSQANIEFKKGYIEKLDELDLEDNSFDIIISNCVINLSTDKEAVLKQAYRLLKPGGEMYFSDVYSNRRIPQSLIDDKVLYGECLSGALYWNDFHNLAKKVGFIDPRLVEDRPLSIDNDKIIEQVGELQFYSATYRLFKIEGLEPACEDYGQAVIYNGGIEHHEDSFTLDKHHFIEKGKVFPVCGNTYRMLNETRFSPFFEFIGNWNTHFGIYQGCGTDIPYSDDNSSGNASDDKSSSCC
ncbi:MAG: methyltransferase domain-containing protein [Methylococcales bacterium]|nr:methyltransferase domain-containing protein [Methylococcales bacterium]